MTKNKRLILSLAAALLPVTGLLATNDFTAGGVKYAVNTDGQSVTIATQDASTIAGAVNIPAQVSDGTNTYTVTAIAGGAFQECTGLTSITLPSTLVTIGTKTVNPQSYYTGDEIELVPTTYTGSGAFAGCTSLTTANLSACQFTETKGAMFAGCTALSSVSLPSTLTKLTGFDFLYCESLHTLNLTNCTSLTEIGEYTCHQDSIGSGVQYVYVPTSLRKIGTSAFYRNDLCKITDLGTASTPTADQVSSYPYLTATSDISNVSHLANVSSIGAYAFGSNYRLHAMVLGSALLDSIPESCFASAFDLRWIILSDNITTIDDFAFKGLGNLHAMANTSGDVKVVSFTTLSDNNNILRLPTSLSEIGKNAFKACSSITTMKYEAIDAPSLWRDHLTIIPFKYNEYYSFDLSQAITMYVPECATGYSSSGSMTNGCHQCWGCFTHIAISKTLPCPDSSEGTDKPNLSRAMAKKSSGSSSPVYYKGIPFELDKANNTAKVLPLNMYASTSDALEAAKENGAYTKQTTSTLTVGSQTINFTIASYVGDVVVPEKITVENVEYTVTSIAQKAFMSERHMTAVELPSSITNIEVGTVTEEYKPDVTQIIDDEAKNSKFQNWPSSGLSCLFAQCYALKKAVINANVEQLGGFCFADCYLLKDVTLPATLTKLDAGVFADCYSLASFPIPENVTTISTGAFYRASIPEEATDVSDYLVMAKMMGMDAAAFAAFINSGAGENIADFSNILSNRLSALSLPSTITEIGTAAFRKCAQLSEICIPASVASINNQAFSETNIGWVQLLGITTLSNINIFDTSKNINFIVPSKDSYSALTSVSNFTVKERYTPEVEAGQYGTLCLGYDAQVPENITLYEVAQASYDEEDASLLRTVTIDAVDTSADGFYIKAGLPYFFLASTDGTADFAPIDEFTFAEAGGTANGLHGLLEETNVAAGVLTLANNKLAATEEATDIAANSAYLVASEIVNTTNALSDKAVTFTIGQPVVNPATTEIAMTGKYATFASSVDVDFSGWTTIKAYVAQGIVNGEVVLYRVQRAAAGEGVLLVAEDGQGNETVVKATTTANDDLANYYDNLFVGVIDEDVSVPATVQENGVDYTNLLLGKPTGKEWGFYKSSGTGTIPVGKAYLHVPSTQLPASGARSLGLRIIDETNGISDALRLTNSEGVNSDVYDLQGRRVAQPLKGSLYIVGGKKTIWAK